MSRNTKLQVEDFIIQSGVESVWASSHFQIKYGRTAEDFVEYLRWVPYKCDANRKIDMRQMVMDYYTSDDKHYFEIVREMDNILAEIDRLEAELSEQE